MTSEADPQRNMPPEYKKAIERGLPVTDRQVGAWWAQCCASDADFERLGSQLAQAHGFQVDPETGQVIGDAEEFNDELGRIRLLQGNQGSDSVAYALARESAGRMTRLLLKDAYRDNADFDREQLLNELRNLAYHDPLTGSWNRRGLGLILDRWQTAQEYQGPTPVNKGLVKIDLTNFKRVNDVLGHHVGDAALLELYLQLDEVVRRNDQPALVRMGGDEFWLLFSNIFADDFEGFMDRLRDVELQKVEAGRQQELWTTIYRLQNEGNQFTVVRQKIQSEVDGKEREVHMLCARKSFGAELSPIVPLRELVVLSAGGAHGTFTDWSDPEQVGYSAEAQAAEAAATEHKQFLHSKMGTYSRP